MHSNKSLTLCSVRACVCVCVIDLVQQMNG